MLYCHRHDLSFCQQHANDCMLEECAAEMREDARATFCTVCDGFLKSKTGASNHAQDHTAKADADEDHTRQDPDLQV